MRRFFAAHETAYGYASHTDAIEIVNVRLSAVARLYQDDSSKTSTDASDTPEPRDRRPAFFNAGQPMDTPIYLRSELTSGHLIAGPAIIEQLDTTTPLYPGDNAKVTRDRHLIIAINQEATAKS